MATAQKFTPSETGRPKAAVALPTGQAGVPSAGRFPTGFTFNPKSLRVKQARLANWLKSPRWQFIFLIKSLVAIACVYLAWQGNQLGYLGLAVVLSVDMVLVWDWWHLQKLPAGRLSPEAPEVALDQVVESQLLPQLTQTLNPQKLWQILDGNWQTRFLSVRFGLDLNAISSQLSTRASDLNAVWQVATDLTTKLGLPEVTAGNMAVAVVLTMPNAQTYLADLKIAPADLTSGLLWLERVKKIMERLKQKPSFGGLGRDWAFGYTPLLNKIGTNISRQVETGSFHLNIEIHDALVQQISSALAQPTKNSVALVGKTGAGKTTLAYSLAEELLLGQAPPALAYNQIFSLNAASLIARAPGRGELEALIIRLLNEAAHAQNTIIFLDDGHLFFGDDTGGVNLGNIIKPVLESGGVRFVIAMTAEAWQKLAASAPDLAATLNFQAVTEPDTETTVAVLQDQALLIEAQTNTTITYQAIQESERLAERYVSEQVDPGRSIKLLLGAANYAKAGVVTAETVQQAVERTMGVKVTLAAGAEKSKLLNLEAELHQRMVNQDYAVKVVADALRRARAGVKNPRRPIGSFMFLGPTGVGKTQLARALAEVYFGDPKNMIRLDMSEYVNSQDVERLLAGSNVSQVQTFLNQVHIQPFSVVLLDEVEKAHPNVLNLLLQMLDEGQLTDSTGRAASFKDAIIIATSNAGADAIRSQIEAGNSLEQFSPQFIDNLINQKRFLPELINRFDEVVLFRPLTNPELTQVVDLMMAEVNQELAQQQISVTLTDQAKNWLVSRGNDPRLGARPLRRMIQRTVENVVAERLLKGTAKPGQQLQLDTSDLESQSK